VNGKIMGFKYIKSVVGQFETLFVAGLVRAWSFHRLTAVATMSIPGSFCGNLKLTRHPKIPAVAPDFISVIISQ
jgi:hypothetical protein